MTGTLVVNGFAHFLPMFHFYNIWKCEKTSAVLTFAGGMETRTLVWNGLICSFINSSLIHSFPMHPFSTSWKHQKTLRTYNQFLGFLNLYQHEKNQLFYLLIFEIKSILESCHQTGHTHFWPCPPNKNFDQLALFVNLYQHAEIVLFHLLIFQIQLTLESRD